MCGNHVQTCSNLNISHFFAAVSFLAPSEAPKNLESGAVTRTSIEISWVAPSAGSFNGHLMGYKVSFRRVACFAPFLLSKLHIRTCCE